MKYVITAFAIILMSVSAYAQQPGGEKSIRYQLVHNKVPGLQYAPEKSAAKPVAKTKPQETMDEKLKRIGASGNAKLATAGGGSAATAPDQQKQTERKLTSDQSAEEAKKEMDEAAKKSEAKPPPTQDAPQK